MLRPTRFWNWSKTRGNATQANRITRDNSLLPNWEYENDNRTSPSYAKTVKGRDRSRWNRLAPAYTDETVYMGAALPNHRGNSVSTKPETRHFRKHSEIRFLLLWAHTNLTPYRCRGNNSCRASPSNDRCALWYVRAWNFSQR